LQCRAQRFNQRGFCAGERPAHELERQQRVPRFLVRDAREHAVDGDVGGELGAFAGFEGGDGLADATFEESVEHAGFEVERGEAAVERERSGAARLARVSAGERERLPSVLGFVGHGL
jgi:hypothetical protein